MRLGWSIILLGFVSTIGNSANASDLDTYLASYAKLPFLSDDTARLEKFAAQAQDFIRSYPGDKADDRFIALIGNQTKLVRFIALKHQIDRCRSENGNASRRKLYDRVLENALNSEVPVNIPTCVTLDQQFQAIENVVRDSDAILTSYRKKHYYTLIDHPQGWGDLKKDILLESRVQAAKTLLLMERQFGNKDLSSGNVRKAVVSKCCGTKGCGIEAQHALKVAGENFAKIAHKIPKTSVTEVQARFKTQFGKLIEKQNELYVAIRNDSKACKEKESWIPSAVNAWADYECNASIQKLHQAYMDQYQSLFMNNEFGLLARTDAVQYFVSSPVELNEVARKARSSHSGATLENVGNWTYTYFDQYFPKAFAEAKGKAIERIEEHCEKLDELSTPKKSVSGNKDDLIELFKTPQAVGAALIRNPQYAGMACQVIQELEEDDALNEDLDRLLKYGSIAVAGVAVASGVGAWAAPSLLAWGTVGTGVLATGLAVGAADVAWLGARTVELNREYQLIENAIASGNGDFENIVESRKLSEEIAWNQVFLPLAALGTVGNGLAITHKSMSLGKALKVPPKKSAQRAQDLLEELEKNSASIKVSLDKVRRSLVNVSDDDFAQFYAALSHQDPAVRSKFIELLKSGQTKKAEDLIQKILVEVKKC